MSEHEYTRELIEGSWNITPRVLRAEIFAELQLHPHISANGADVKITFRDDEVDVVDLDPVITAHQATHIDRVMSKLRQLAFKRTDERTTGIIFAGGFEYPLNSGDIYSLSERAQLRFIGAHRSRDLPTFGYPLVINTKDDMKSIELQDAAQLDDFYLHALAAIRAYIDTQNPIKAQIRAATTPQEIRAVNDPR